MHDANLEVSSVTDAWAGAVEDRRWDQHSTVLHLARPVDARQTGHYGRSELDPPAYSDQVSSGFLGAHSSYAAVADTGGEN